LLLTFIANDRNFYFALVYTINAKGMASFIEKNLSFSVNRTGFAVTNFAERITLHTAKD
jgi:hypothetical protein